MTIILQSGSAIQNLCLNNFSWHVSVFKSKDLCVWHADRSDHFKAANLHVHIHFSPYDTMQEGLVLYGGLFLGKAPPPLDNARKNKYH